MIQRRFLLCLLCLLGSVGAVRAETTNVDSEFLVKSWQNEDGLPQSIINSIVQTHDGYLWIGTYVGLVRFDGERFVQYSARNVPDLENDEIIYLYQGTGNTLWISLQSGGLLAWHEGNVRVVLPDNSKQQPVIHMARQTDGTLWVETSDGSLGMVTTNGVRFVLNSADSPIRANRGLVVDAANHLWVGTDHGLKLWQQDRLISPKLDALDGKPVEDMIPSRDGAVWTYYNRRLYKVQFGKTLKVIKAPDQLQGVASMLETSSGWLWLGANEGTLYYRKPDATDWEEIPQTGFRGLNRVLYEDHEGNVWRGGFGGGLTRIRPHIFTLHELPGNSINRYARAVCADQQGNVWAILDAQVLSCIPAGSWMPEARTNSGIANGIKALFVDRQGSLWAGTDGGHLYRLKEDAHDNPFALKINLGTGIDYISAIFEDAASNLWIGYTGGAGVAVLPHGDPARWHPVAGLAYPDVRTITQASDGAIWFGTHYGGAFRWQHGQWTGWTIKDGLPSNYVRCLLADPDGTIWIGTIHGLCRWRAGKLVPITSEDGLWNDSISYITTDQAGNFWISSFGGIFRISRKDLNRFADGEARDVKCVGYDRNDGLPSVECPGGVQSAGAKTPDGRLWFPTVVGLVSVDPKHMPHNQVPPPVWIENLTVDGKSIPIQHSAKRIRIGPGKRRFDFRFTALSFTSPEKVRFEHKLAGLDADWSPADHHRSVIYNYIPPGHYIFQVAAGNNDGVWNWQGQKLAIIVQPFIWQTWWFKVLVGLGLAAALTWGVRRRERWKARLRVERLEREHAVEHERSRIAKDIHDDLGANLTQIVFLSQRVEGVRHQPSEVERWIRKIPAAASRTIQSLDEIVWAINPKHDSLESLANYLSRFAHDFLTLAGVRCLLEVPTVLPQIPLSAEGRHNLILTAREALQNAVTHAIAKEVKVSLQLNEAGLKIAVTDNGCGFDPGRVAKPGNGLANMRKRMEDIGGTLEIISEPGKGTAVRLKLPAHRLTQPGIGK